MRSASRFYLSSAIGPLFLIVALGAAIVPGSVSALNLATPASLAITADDQLSGDRIEVRVARGGGGGRHMGGGGRHMGGGGRHVAGGGMAYHRGGAVVGRRGGAAYRHTAVVGRRGNVVVRNRAVVVGRGGWARPGWYGWPRGGAIAAGAAIGFVTAATAAAWAGPPPSAGMCWYYTDPSRTQGFWDYCQ
jgi:hypothetical protein